MREPRPRRKILFVCGREPEYVRNRVILKALRRQFDVIEISSSLRNIILRSVSVFVKFILNHREYDLVFVGFYGHPLMLWVPRLTRSPIVFDAYLSTYDTLCFDRQWFEPTSLRGRLAYWLDSYACRAASRVILDTKAHVSYFTNTFGLSPQRFSVLYICCDTDIFYPRQAASDGKFRVLYCGSFLPLHGVDHIMRAAKLLEEDPQVEVQLVGQGAIREEMIRLAGQLDLSNVQFPGWIPFQELPRAIAEASVCLGGHFSATAKAQRVIASKTFQFLAMAKPTIVGDNPASRELFTHKKNVYMCPPADSAALADAILMLKGDEEMRRRIAQEGYRLFMQKCSVDRISQSLKGTIESVYEDLSD